MMRAITLGVLLLALVASETGCALGYVTFFQPEVKGAREVGHQDPYMRPPPPSAVEVAGGTLSIGCTNIRKFVFLPIPWLRRGFRPTELQLEVAFSGEPKTAQVDLGAVAVKIAGASIRPNRIEYEGRRPAPQYVETIRLPIGGRATLDAPTHITFTFNMDAGDAEEFQLSLGEVGIDGKRTLLAPVPFEREGDFVSYHNPDKKKAPADGEEEGGDVF
jgi:hypothetical protein